MLANSAGGCKFPSRASSLLPGATFNCSRQALAAAGETTAQQPATSPACQEWSARQIRLEQGDSAIKRTLAQVLQADEFPHCAPTSAWRFDWDGRAAEEQWSQPLEFPLGAWLAQAIEMIAWTVLLGFIAAVVWRLATLPPRTAPPSTATPSLSPDLAFLPESLAPTTAMAAWRLWQAEQPREALGLLYRSSLAGVRARYGLQFNPGATENECLRLIGTSLADRPELIRFLTRLTRHWQAAAYAHRLPDSPAMQELCEQWPRHFLD